MRVAGIIIAMGLFTIQLSAQVTPLPRAGVHTIAGKASVVRKGKPVFLKQGDYIFSNDTITVKKSALLTLLTQDLKFIEIKQPGNYSYVDLVKGLSTKKISISEKYADLLWHDL